jgi:hypothetical protein
MMSKSRLFSGFIASAFLFVTLSASLAAQEPPKSDQTAPKTLSFGGVDYLHRWSKDGQNEFTPKGQEDLDKWRDMISINVHEAVVNGDQLADLANRVIGNYQSAGEIVRTDSKPRTPQREAEHLIVALLTSPSTPKFLEAAFARFVLVNGVGYVVVYSRRMYGEEAVKIGEWVQANGLSVEAALMAWDKMPAASALKRLPQNK